MPVKRVYRKNRKNIRRYRNLNYNNNMNRKYKKRQNKYTRIQSLIVKQPGVIVPDRLFVRLRWTDQTNYLLSATGVGFGFISYRANGPYDPLASLLTSFPVGFKELATLYSRYRVHSCKIRISVSNMENFPVNVVVWPEDVNLTGTVNDAYIQSAMSGPFAKSKVLSAKGGNDKFVMTNYISTKKLIGTNATKFENDWASLVSNNPTRLWYWNVGVYALNFDTFTAANVPFDCRLTYYFEFYDRQPLIQTTVGVDVDDDGDPIGPI